MESEEEKLNKKWTDRKLIEETIKSMNLHNEPAEETKLRLQALELNQKNIMEKLEEHQKTNEKSHETIMASMKEFHLTTNQSLKDMTEKLDKALEKKADKEVVNKIILILFWLGGLIGAGLLTYIGSLIIKATVHFG